MPLNTVVMSTGLLLEDGCGRLAAKDGSSSRLTGDAWCFLCQKTSASEEEESESSSPVKSYSSSQGAGPDILWSSIAFRAMYAFASATFFFCGGGG